MRVDLSAEDINDLLESLEFSKERIRDYSDVTYEVRRSKLNRLETVEAKLRQAKKPSRERGVE